MIVTDLHVSGSRFNNPLLPMEHILKSSQDVAAANKILQFLKSWSNIKKFGSSHLSSLVSPSYIFYPVLERKYASNDNNAEEV